MTASIIVRMPEEKRERLKALARSRGISVNRLIDEATTAMLAEQDAQVRFALRAERGTALRDHALELLDRAAGSDRNDPS